MKAIRPPDEILPPVASTDDWMATKSRRHIGFTGTQAGMTEEQAATVAQLLLLYKPRMAHHGDCIGADEAFHNLARSQGVPIEIHPPKNPTKRAYCTHAVKVHEEDAYLRRNEAIVMMCDTMIATPKEREEVLRSGTWSTIRRTSIHRKPLTIVWPDGTTTHYSVGYKAKEK